MNPFIQQLLNKARNTVVRAATGFDVQTRRNMGPQIRRALGFEALNPYSNPIVSAAKKDPSLLTAATKGALVFPGVRASGGLVGGAVALDAANSTGLTGAIEGGLNQVGPGLDRFFGAVTPKPVQDFGRSMEQYGWGALGGFVPGERTAASVSTPERAKGTQAILNGKPVYWTGSKYGWQSGLSAAKAGLLGSEVVGDDVFAPVIGTTLTPPAAPIPPSITNGAAQRNYEAEKSRATQLATQDQLSKKYQVADLTNAYNTAVTPEEKERIGLQIWATTNPELAQKLKPGQTGYSEAVSAFQSQSPLGAVTKAAGGMQYADLSQQSISPPVGQGGIPLDFSPTQLQTPLTGIEIPPTNRIGVKEFFSDTKPAPGAMGAFTDQMRLFFPEKLDETKRALLVQAFNKGLK